MFTCFISETAASSTNLKSRKYTEIPLPPLLVGDISTPHCQAILFFLRRPTLFSNTVVKINTIEYLYGRQPCRTKLCSARKGTITLRVLLQRVVRFSVSTIWAAQFTVALPSSVLEKAGAKIRQATLSQLILIKLVTEVYIIDCQGKSMLSCVCPACVIHEADIEFHLKKRGIEITVFWDGKPCIFIQID